ncbi:hypothetical protein [Deinococcus hopiensis]|uniref:HTH-type transcriptional regulator / antitoxin HipB n=1 Tax=Deinococcus hopiensis KR-140 TaxID=695939 RepID=A0A1W1VIK8_9DEIO|nr:hypothetical protein [Deinococcus hopiensis]SMB93158.1 HTH-type transcriptional regulator / antitoxin HipB [Deinococcus hopiensis KR-140]
MSETPREAVQAALKTRGMNQSQLAAQLGKGRASISRTLARSPIDPRSDWQTILDMLGLELIIQPKQQQ